MTDLFDWTPPETAPHVRGSATSREAAEAIQPKMNRLQVTVLAAIRGAGVSGLTDEQGIDITGMSPSTYRPRRIELATKKGMIVDSGRTRLTRSGRHAVIWVSSQG